MSRGEPVVDLRSDTVTRPTPGMREAIAGADVGDDVLDGDPTVRALEARVAELLGKEGALFFPSGIMANETAILAQAEPGTEVVTEARGHIVDWEDAAAAQWAGVQLRCVETPDGLLDAGRVEAAIRAAGPYAVRTGLVCLENTHNAAGGRVLAAREARAIREVTASRGIPVHLDGARLWNAAAALGIPERDLAAPADTVMFTLSKGLGCPVGSLLAFPAALRERIWRIRRRLGGAMRQAGILAAAGLYALDHHRARLAEDHARARRLAEGAAEAPGVRIVPPETNIVMIEAPEDAGTTESLARSLEERGVRMIPFDARRLRAVTHLDVDDAGIERAVSALLGVLGEARRT